MGNFGKYEVVCEVGRGGMGVIYKAQDPALKRAVAIKQLILDQVDPDKREEFKERFRREAQLIANLSHPNLVYVYDVSISDDNNGMSYYVMEFLEGHSFRKEIETSPNQRLTPEDFYPLLKQTCEGLQYAHDMNLVHRDIKPDNIFIISGNRVKLTDFGIARSAESDHDSNLTKPGVMLGTLSYVSPEQLQDARNVNCRADIYSLGVVMYEALSGQLPFSGDGLTSTLMAIVSKEAKPVHEVNPALSMDISAVVNKAMRKKAQDRYGSAMECLQDFEKALNLVRSSPSGSVKVSSSTVVPGVSSGLSQGAPLVAPRSAGIPLTKSEISSGKTLGKPWMGQRPGGAPEDQQSSNIDLAKFVGTVGKGGESRGCFQEPAMITCRLGKIVVGDTSKRNLLIMTRDGRFLGESTSNPLAKDSKTQGGVFSQPSSIAMDSRGRIYATDNSDHYIRVYDGQGKYLKELVNRQGKKGGLNGIVCDTAGMLYVSDPENGCVHILNSELGNWMRKVGNKGIADGQLQLPSGLALDRAGQLFVVDYGTSKVSVFSKAGIFQRSFGGKGSGPGLFNVPRGIAIDSYDRVYIADSFNHRVAVFDSKGTYLTFIGGRGQEPGRFVGPADLSIDPENNCLYVADKGNSRIQVFELLKP